jgi:two-component system, OmpR family, alkaline phosphatase synthesis response regulator PhoP
MRFSGNRNMKRGTVLVIDDEVDLVELVRYNLEKDGYWVRTAPDGESGLALAVAEQPDLILLDVMLPGIDGLEVCRKLRSEPRTLRIPVIMLTARVAESDKIVGLELGADDYVTKPFSQRELVARVKAQLRRASISIEPAEVIKQGNLRIDMNRREVTCGGIPVSLTATEFKLLQFLASQPGRVFSRSELIDGVLGQNIAILDRTIDVHIVSLRKKLRHCGDLIETVRGFGYKFAD